MLFRSRTDIGHLLGMTQSMASLRHSVKILARHLRDRIGHPRGTRLVMGNALVARLFFNLRQAGVSMRFGARLQRLEIESGRVVGAAFDHEGTAFQLKARAGVVLATGGVGHHAQLRALLAPAGVAPGALRSQAFSGNRGEGIDAAMQIGRAHV